MSTSRNEPTSNYVEPLRDPVQVVEVEVSRNLPIPPNTVLLPQANYTDRARGFSYATAPLAGVVGIVAALVGISAFSVPVLSVVALLLILAGFAVTWLVAYVAYVVISPDGSLFVHVVLTWRMLFLEARERRARYKQVRHE